MLERKENILEIKVEALSNRIVRMVKYLRRKEAEPSMLNQVIRSGTSIGANVCEARFAQSRADFVNKLSIALKETNETDYWTRKLHTAENLNDKEFESINKDINEVTALLVSIINRMKKNGL